MRPDVNSEDKPPGADLVPDLVRNWKEDLLHLRPDLNDLTIEVSIDVFPGMTFSFWHFSFEIGENYVEAIAGGDLQSFLFADDRGAFEIDAPVDDVPRKVADLFPR